MKLWLTLRYGNIFCCDSIIWSIYTYYLLNSEQQLLYYCLANLYSLVILIKVSFDQILLCLIQSFWNLSIRHYALRIIFFPYLDVGISVGLQRFQEILLSVSPKQSVRKSVLTFIWWIYMHIKVFFLDIEDF